MNKYVLFQRALNKLYWTDNENQPRINRMEKYIQENWPQQRKQRGFRLKFTQYNKVD